MWKAGQTVTANGKRYRVTKCHAIKQSIVCMVCAQMNIGTPCLESNNYPTTKEPFSVYKCLTNIQKGCYLKRET